MPHSTGATSTGAENSLSTFCMRNHHRATADMVQWRWRQTTKLDATVLIPYLVTLESKVTTSMLLFATKPSLNLNVSRC